MRLSTPTLLSGLAAATALAALATAPVLPRTAAAEPARPASAQAQAAPRWGDAATTVTVTARPSAESERLRLGQALRASDLTPTGLYVPAGTGLRVQVTPIDGKLPTLWIGTWDYYGEVKTPRSYTLRDGSTTVTDPHGGPVYLSLPGNGERAEVQFRSGATRMPAFRLGRTTEDGYQDALNTFTASPYVEFTSPHGIVTVTREAALLYRDQDHETWLKLLETVIASHAAISGLDGARPEDRRNANLFHFTEVSRVPSGVGAFATHGYNGFPRAYLDRLLTVDGLRTRGWGLYHELGHSHQQTVYKPSGLTEVTVNIYSLAAQRTLGQPSNLVKPDAGTGLTPYQSALPKLGKDGLAYETSFAPMEKLVPLRQLELAFGNDFWPRLHRLVRQEKPQAGDNAQRYRALAVLSSRVAGRDLTDFFVTRWAFPIDAQGKAELAALKLPKPGTDPSTLAE
ncbi:M60 family metallopeptidase [Spirillospora sp. CA-294931]|uniref:M60 family metallopeptidase n=1 Tax=Spirillospora sp. CA-294931 TaxID=3240042 RepID=UPI003D910139